MTPSEWGYINTKNRTVIALIYDNVFNFKDGMSWVRLNDDNFIIDTQGKQVK